jgi:NADP-reducing hydrogenase subunit HndB
MIMAKIKPDDLDKIGDKIKRTMLLREGTGRAKVIVHMGTCGIAAGARTVMKALMDEIESREVKDVLLTISSCAGLCSREPMVTVELTGEPAVKYVDLTPEKAKRVFEEHVLGGKIVTEYALAAGSERTL